MFKLFCLDLENYYFFINMYPLILINLLTISGLIYFFIKLYKIKNYYCFDMHKKNWYPSLGIQGFKLSYVMNNINILYLIGGVLIIWIFIISNDTSLYYYFAHFSISICFLFFTRFMMGLIGQKVLYEENLNIQDIDIELDDQPKINHEFRIIKNIDNYFKYECCICLEDKKFVTRTELGPCKHDIFCKDCINRVTNKTCPICRQNINKIKIFIKKN